MIVLLLIERRLQLVAVIAGVTPLLCTVVFRTALSFVPGA